ncbi:hypothetical protein BCR39DRAFT_545926 [Naematelia encephala]|uniref:J domain-containing protein n=1 Tax=Naematelia encephala TaxID=71784 RepID=A0A1Y2AQP3_9TREE|nr:hypothetical protein BCR39DRAFT_545926 [Naematelia encephala]
MRISYLLALLGCLVVALAWTKDDYEIFDLVSELEAAEGKGVNFYSHVGVDPSATLSEINKAYRKKSMELHPDKNHGLKDADKRFARFGVIAQILRSPERRERYNFFLKNGVPKWRGVGYLYSRWRPSLSQVLLFLIGLTASLHRLVLQLNYSRDKRRVEYFTRSAQSAAGVLTGPSAKIRAAKENDIVKEEGKAKGKAKGKGKSDKLELGLSSKSSSLRRRKVKVPMVQGNEAAGYLELVVQGDQVLLPQGHGLYTPLSSLATRPSILHTWPFTLTIYLTLKITPYLPLSIQSKLPPTFLPPSNSDDLENSSSSDADDDDDDNEGISTPTPAPKSRIQELKRARQKKSISTSAEPEAANINNIADDAEDGNDDDDDAGTGTGTDGDNKKKKKGLGKAGGARRRKMTMKK